MARLVLLAGLMLAGCRSQASPTVNPFGPTRVPPGATGAAAPGNVAPQYYPGVTPGTPMQPPGTLPGTMPGAALPQNGPGATWMNRTGAVEGPGNAESTSGQPPMNARQPAAVPFPAEVAASPPMRETSIRIPTDAEELVPQRQFVTPAAAVAPVVASAPAATPEPAPARQPFVQTLEPRVAAGAVPATSQAGVSQAAVSQAATSQAVPQALVLVQPQLQPIPQAQFAAGRRGRVVNGRCVPCNSAAPMYQPYAPTTVRIPGSGQPTLAGARARVATPASVELSTLAGATNGVVASATPTQPNTVNYATQATFVAAGSKAAADAVAQYGYQSEYQWITGRLEYSEAAREWKLRYIPVDDPADPHGGSLTLANGDAVAGFKPGEFVTLEGKLAPSTPGGNPSSAGVKYQIARVKPLAE